MACPTEQPQYTIAAPLQPNVAPRSTLYVIYDQGIGASAEQQNIIIVVRYPSVRLGLPGWGAYHNH